MVVHAGVQAFFAILRIALAVNAMMGTRLPIDERSRPRISLSPRSVHLGIWQSIRMRSKGLRVGFQRIPAIVDDRYA